MHFQLHGMQQQSSENKSAALKKSYYFCSHALIERPKINPQLLQNNLYMGMSHFSFSFFFFLNFLSLRPKENIYRKIETQT